MFIIGLGLGLVFSWFRLHPLLDYQFNKFEYTKNVRFEYYEISRTFRAIGIFGLIMLLYKSGWFKWLFALMRPVGQMAFTNYLMQSIIFVPIFYGFELGLATKINLGMGILFGMIIFYMQVKFSKWWLNHFIYGPFEWLWRSLTWLKRQPMKKRYL